MFTTARPTGVALLLAVSVGLAACGESATDASPRGTSTGGAARGTDTTGTVSLPEPGAAGNPATSGLAPRYRNPNVLAVGDCFNPVNDSLDGALLAAVILPCSSPHRHEVFGLPELAGAPTTPYPGRSDLAGEAQDLCHAAFESYVGIPFSRSDHGYVYYAPVASEWAAGERRVRCVVDDGTMLTGSIRDTRR